MLNRRILVQIVIKENKKQNLEAPNSGCVLAFQFVNNIIIIYAVLVIFAGLMSGLTVGYLSIDTLDLEIKQAIGTPEEKK